ncbi:MAG: penicillin-binding transpeptidase domain-containing protein, partial [Planctomycetota bacterium]
EPGSTFKPFVWAIATELGYADADEILPTPAERYYRTSQGRRIRDTHLIGDASWRTCLIRSLNSGMAIVAERMSHAEMQDVIDRFGFGIPTRCGVPGESAGVVTPRARWSHYTQTSVPMGHEIAVTALQMVRAFSAVARDGTLPALRLVAPMDNEPATSFLQRACSRETALLVREVLRDAVIEGSGRPARSSRYQIFGKSGTPQLPRPEGGGYFEDRYVPSFIAGAPFENPRIVVLCVIDDPDRRIAHFGGPVAGPVVRDVIDGTLEYLGVPASDSPTPADS